MSNREGTSNSPLSFKEESNFKNKILVFHDRLKRHLNTEYAYLMERRDAMESEMAEMKFELEQKDKKLFKTHEQKDTRQYFSPLNLVDIDENNKDERIRQLTMDVERIQGEINQFDARLREIQELLVDIDSICESMDNE